MKLKLALLAGDGIGPEVINQAVKVCNSIAQKFDHEIKWMPALTGADAIDKLGDPTLTKHTKFALKLTLYFLEQSVTQDLTTTHLLVLDLSKVFSK